VIHWCFSFKLLSFIHSPHRSLTDWEFLPIAAVLLYIWVRWCHGKANWLQPYADAHSQSTSWGDEQSCDIVALNLGSKPNTACKAPSF
jgi:hypothetical protein